MPLKKEGRRLGLGILGCGPIAQFAHFEAARKARNVELYAICDVADDLRERMAVLHQPNTAYRDYAAMLADPQVEAVLDRHGRPVSRARCARRRWPPASTCWWKSRWA